MSDDKERRKKKKALKKAMKKEKKRQKKEKKNKKKKRRHSSSSSRSRSPKRSKKDDAALDDLLGEEGISAAPPRFEPSPPRSRSRSRSPAKRPAVYDEEAVYMAPPDKSRDFERGRDEPYKFLPDEAGGEDFPDGAARETAEALVAEREACRKARDYQQSDQIRDELRKAPHNVYISDLEHTWRRCTGDGPPWGERPPRQTGPYTRAPDDEGATDFPDDEARDAAEALIAERAACKVSRDYKRADEIRDELRQMKVHVNDLDRTYRRSSGTAPPRRERPVFPPYARLPDDDGAADFPDDEARNATEALIAERAACRASRDYARADTLRDELRKPPHSVFIIDRDRTYKRIAAVRGRGQAKARRERSRSRSRSRSRDKRRRSPSPSPDPALTARRARNAERFAGGAAKTAGVATLGVHSSNVDFEESSVGGHTAPVVPQGPSAAELRQERLRVARERQEALRKQMAAELPPPSAAPPKTAPAPAPPAAPRFVSLKSKPKHPPAPEDHGHASAADHSSEHDHAGCTEDHDHGEHAHADHSECSGDHEAHGHGSSHGHAEAESAAPAKPSKKPAAKPAAKNSAKALAPEPVAEATPAAAPKWSTSEVNKMTVPKLKTALTELGLATDGLKAALKARLEKAL